MSRLRCFILALVLAPLAVDAQQPAATGRTHTVRSGDTLGGIARQYLGGSSEWPRIFEANRDRLADPNLLRVGTVLVIPTVAPAASASASVTSVQVGLAPTAAQDVPSFEARRALMRTRPFAPRGIPPVLIQDRSVFFQVPEPQARAAIVVLEGAQSVPAFPESVYHAAGWLIPGPDADRLGEIVGFADNRDLRATGTTAQLHDEVYVRFSVEGGPQPGDEFLVYRISRRIEGLGSVADPTGRVRIVQVEGTQAVAEIVQAFGRMSAGQLLTRAGTFSMAPGVRPSPVQGGTGATVLAMQEVKEIYLPGDFAFIDAGLEDGLALGDELVGFPGDGENWAQRGAARFQVVGLREDMGTVRVLSSIVPPAVRPGLQVEMDRRMP